jgi:hypothetical protein
VQRTEHMLFAAPPSLLLCSKQNTLLFAAHPSFLLCSEQNTCSLLRPPLSCCAANRTHAPNRTHALCCAPLFLAVQRTEHMLFAAPPSFLLCSEQNTCSMGEIRVKRIVAILSLHLSPSHSHSPSPSPLQKNAHDGAVHFICINLYCTHPSRIAHSSSPM